jgi:4'-phosphopantetheinyl transferase EntD
MIGSLLPAGAVAFEAYADRWERELLPDERALVATAVEKRHNEFAAGRNCARRALERLGWRDFPVLSGRSREPLWPPGVVGSITHCRDYCAAVAAPVEKLEGIQGLGIDAELNTQLPPGVVDLVSRPSELRALDRLPGVSAAALLFSAKESVYKAWFPVAGRWLGYQDAEIAFDPPTSRFAVRLLPSSAPLVGHLIGLTFAGRFATTASHVFTLVTVTMTRRPDRGLPLSPARS